MVVRIPTPTGGYVNLGDAVVLLGAYLLGPGWGAAAGRDRLCPGQICWAGYPLYIPATLVIKAAMAASAGGLYHVLRGKRGGSVLCGVLAESLMVLGYWLFDALLSSAGDPSFWVALSGAAAGIPGNLMQAVFGVAASTALTAALRKSPAIRREFPKL